MASAPSMKRDDVALELAALLVGPPVLTLAAAESLTSGHIQAAIGGVSGASRYFRGGITAYTLEEKARHLGVKFHDADKDDAVSAAVAAQMAIGACRMFRSDLAVATTGYAEPVPDRGFAEPGAFWAVARSGGSEPSIVRQGLFKCAGLDRIGVQQAVTDEVLAALADFLRIFRAAQQGSKFV